MNEFEKNILLPLVENMADPVLILDEAADKPGIPPGLIISFINSSGLEFLKRDEAAFIGKPVISALPLLCEPDIISEIKNLTHFQTPQKIHTNCRKLSGDNLDVIKLEITVIKSSDGYILVLSPRTGRRASEDSFKSEKAEAGSLFENIPIGAYLTTSEGQILIANNVLIEMLGYISFKELAERNLEEEGYENQTYTREEFKNRLEEKGEIKGFESAWKKKSGELIYVRENARIVKEIGGVKYYEGTVEDITEVKKAEMEVRKNEEFTTSIINSLSCHLAVLDENGIIIKVNRAWEIFASENNAAGYVFIGADYMQVCRKSATEDALKALAGIQSVLSGERPEFNMEYTCHSEEERRWFIMNVKPLKNKGTTICHINITQNILFQEELEITLSRLNKNQSMLNDAQKLAHVGSYSFDVRTGKNEWTEEMYNIFEIDKNQSPPSDEEVMKLFHPDDSARLLNIIQESIQNRQEFYTTELCIMLHNPKRIKYVQILGRIYYDAAGNAVRYFGAIADITHLKLAQLRLEKAHAELERSNSDLLQFAYIASHDLQEPLRMVSGFIRQLKNDYASQLDTTAQHYIHSALDGAERMKQLIKDLLTYSRVSTKPKEYSQTDLNIVISEVLLDLQVTIEDSKASIMVEKLPIVRADEVQMRQLFQNLIGNAIKFRGEAPPEIRISAEKTGRFWKITIEDNGIGIAEKEHERVFKIFQRLHEPGKYEGTGIGLAICKKIVERHKGQISISSETGKGTTFNITLPDRH